MSDAIDFERAAEMMQAAVRGGRWVGWCTECDLTSAVEGPDDDLCPGCGDPFDDIELEPNPKPILHLIRGGRLVTPERATLYAVPDLPTLRPVGTVESP